MRAIEYAKKFEHIKNLNSNTSMEFIDIAAIITTAILKEIVNEKSVTLSNISFNLLANQLREKRDKVRAVEAIANKKYKSDLRLPLNTFSLMWNDLIKNISLPTTEKYLLN